jgi:hypothetical protein
VGAFRLLPVFGTAKLVTCSLLCSLLLLYGCGGSASPLSTDSAATTQPSAVPPPQDSTKSESEVQDSAQAPAQFAENELAADACKALPLAAVESFDRRLNQQIGGSVVTCSYSTPAERTPFLQLILEMVPSPAEPSESAAKTICHKLINEIHHDPDYEGSEAVPALGEESNVASGFVKADSNLDEDETTYVADWREDGSCVRLIFAGSGSTTVEPLPKFIALAESVSTSGASSTEQTAANSAGG